MLQIIPLRFNTQTVSVDNGDNGYTDVADVPNRFTYQTVSVDNEYDG